MKKKFKVLVLIDSRLIPPEDATKEELEKAPYRTEFYVIKTLKSHGHKVHVLGLESDLKSIRTAREDLNPDIAFNLLEEFAGEAVFDHNVVSYLELINLPYTGCNPKGLLLSRDKALSKKILYYHRIKTPRFAVAHKNRKFKRPKRLEFPLIVKSLVDEGSTGISQKSIVYDDKELKERIGFIHDNESTGSTAIIESYIEGRDIYVSILGNRRIIILPPLELIFKNAPDRIHQIATSKVKWDPDYREKYEIDIDIPKLPEEQISQIEKISKRIYRILGLSGYARLDLRLSDSGKIYFIEANPNPDISKGEEFAYSAKRAKINYPDLLNKIMTLGLSFKPGSTY